MMKVPLSLILIFSLFGFQPVKAQENILTINVSQKGAPISPGMYGVFFEEISHAGDGGLYAEMVQNRGFEERDVPPTCKIENGYLIVPQKPNYLNGSTGAWKMPWDTVNKWPGWSLKMNGTSRAMMKLTSDNPLNAATPHSMVISINKAQTKEQVELINEGYWGIAVKKDEKYDLRFYLRADKDYTGIVVARLENEDGETIGKQEMTIKSYDTWNEYTCTLQPKKSDNKARLSLGFTARGKVQVDYVSLFPQKTFMNRKNGLRMDVAQTIADLKPAFVRWPGGCIVEGLTLENRVKWKETLGDPLQRPGVFDLWGYRNSYGFGFHEYLQFCEDIGASAMFVCNAGLACAYRNGDYCTEAEVTPFIQDALEAIEYAIGDTATTWGKKRAASGHPAPFPLKYIEVGNENYGAMYAKRFNAFYNAIKEKYPKISVISTVEFNNEVALLDTTDMIDPHYYRNPSWFFNHTHLFDTNPIKPGLKLYVGEYASNQGVGNGNMEAALSEAAFMIGMERNSNLVSMCSYAPLLENSNARNWPVNLIWLNNHKVFGRSSYYVQKMFSENKPTVNLTTNLQLTGLGLPKTTFKGLVGLGTNKTQAAYKDFKITQSGTVTYKADFIDRQNDWEPVYGHWRVENDTYLQGDLEEHRCSFVRKESFENCSVEVKARKSKGSEGFSIIFSGSNYQNYYQFTVGAAGVLLEKVEGGVASAVTSPVTFALEDNRWYDVKLVMSGDEVECFINGQSLLKYKIKEIEKRYAIAGIDEAKNEIVIKIVNAESVPFKTSVKIEGAGTLEGKGQIITLSAKSLNEENTFKDPTKISPKTEDFNGFSSHFEMEFKPYSLTVLRMKRK